MTFDSFLQMTKNIMPRATSRMQKEFVFIIFPTLSSTTFMDNNTSCPKYIQVKVKHCYDYILFVILIIKLIHITLDNILLAFHLNNMTRYK